MIETSGSSLMTFEEFFEFEEYSEVRHEYVDGAVFEVSAPSVKHERIKQRLIMAFVNHLSRGPCEVFSSGMALVIKQDESEFCYYPDIMVDCLRDASGHIFYGRPKLIVEILSPSTQRIDRREKLQTYRQIDSVEEYVLAAQDECKVTFYRRADGWRPQECADRQAVVEFRSIDLTLPLSEIYRDVIVR